MLSKTLIITVIDFLQQIWGKHRSNRIYPWQIPCAPGVQMTSFDSYSPGCCLDWGDEYLAGFVWEILKIFSGTESMVSKSVLLILSRPTSIAVASILQSVVNNMNKKKTKEKYRAS